MLNSTLPHHFQPPDETNNQALLIQIPKSYSPLLLPQSPSTSLARTTTLLKNKLPQEPPGWNVIAV